MACKTAATFDSLKHLTNAVQYNVIKSQVIEFYKLNKDNIYFRLYQIALYCQMYFVCFT